MKPKIVQLPSKKPQEDAPVKPSKDDKLGLAKFMEDEGNFAEASKLYEKLLVSERLREYTYNRLMMIYRKQKDFKNELRVIDLGIKVFQDFYLPSAVGKNKSIISLSKKLNVLIGLTDKKGKSLSDAEPIRKWKKRKEIVLKKLKKK